MLSRRSFFKRLAGAALVAKVDPIKLLKALEPKRPSRYWDTVQHKYISRMDVLYGFGVVTPESTARMSS
jgi:CTP:phosphocholine cytidylyltransferase-like protein